MKNSICLLLLVLTTNLFSQETTNNFFDNRISRIEKKILKLNVKYLCKTKFLIKENISVSIIKIKISDPEGLNNEIINHTSLKYNNQRDSLFSIILDYPYYEVEVKNRKKNDTYIFKFNIFNEIIEVHKYLDNGDRPQIIYVK